MNKEIKYLVVVIGTSLNEDLPVYPFTSHDKAVNFMRNTWQHDLDTELAMNETVDMENTYCTDECAKLTWADGNSINYILTYPSDVDMEA